MQDSSKPSRVALYVRVSTEEQAEHGYSIDAQLDALRKLCGQLGKEIVDEYVDRGVSGKEMTKRLELNRMLADGDRKKFDEVFVWKMNRLSRKTKDLLEIVDRLSRNNICFRSCSENFETETPAGRLTFQMLGVIGEFERNTIVENVKLGMKQRARTGRWNGGAALGYCSRDTGEETRRGKATILEIVPEEALIVRKIFDRYAAGRGFRSIANELNHEGHRTKKGNTFGSDSVREILRNPLYVGNIRYNRFEGWSEKRRRGKTSQPIVAEGRHEGIIDRELWERVQRLMADKAKVSPRTYDGVSLLTGLIRCPDCGTPMVASRTVNYLKDGTKVVRRYYSCGQFRSKGSSVCKANSVQADYAERQVVDRLKQLLLRPKLLQDIVAAVNGKRAASVGPMEQELTAIAGNLQQLAEKKKRVMDAYEMEAIDRDTFMARMEALTAAEDTLQARKERLTKELGPDAGRPVPVELVKNLLSQLDRLLAESPPEQQKTLLHLAIKEILVRGREIWRIVLTLTEKLQAELEAAAPSAQTTAEGAFSLCREPWVRSAIILAI